MKRFASKFCCALPLTVAFIEQQRFVYGGAQKGSINQRNVLATHRQKHGNHLGLKNPEGVEHVTDSKEGQLHRQRLNRFNHPETTNIVPRYNWSYVLQQLETAGEDRRRQLENVHARSQSRQWLINGGSRTSAVSRSSTTQVSVSRSSEEEKGLTSQKEGQSEQNGQNGQNVEHINRVINYELKRALPILKETSASATLADVAHLCEILTKCGVKLVQVTSVTRASDDESIVVAVELSELINAKLQSIMTVKQHAGEVPEGKNESTTSPAAASNTSSSNPLRADRLNAQTDRYMGKIVACYSASGLAEPKWQTRTRSGVASQSVSA